jgi:hypothetical protein
MVWRKKNKFVIRQMPISQDINLIHKEKLLAMINALTAVKPLNHKKDVSTSKDDSVAN